MDLDAIFQGIADSVIIGKENTETSHKFAVHKKGEPGVVELVKECLAANVDVATILQRGLIAGMDVVGVKFRNQEIWVPHVMMSAKAMKAGMALIRPLLVETGVKPVASFIVGTVRGDQHDIGKNLVCMMMEGAGFVITDLGINTPPEKFVQTIEACEGARIIVGMSALLTTTMPNMKVTIDAMREAGLYERKGIKVMVGGAPVTRDFADEIGSDGYAADAAAAVQKAKELVGLMREPVAV